MTEVTDPVADAVAALPPLREVIRAHLLSARKALGQNFLLDLNVTARIARGAGDLTGVGVVEIGPGPGGLTRALVRAGAREIVAIERDPRCVAALQPLVAAAGGRLRVIEGDALALDPASLVAAPRAIIANLPYNIATPLLLGWLRTIVAYRLLVLMLQKEVAGRLAARPGSDAYGRLSVITQWRAEVRALFDLPPAAFTPPPKVTSTVVRLSPRAPAALEPAWESLERVTEAAFGQRRKMLRQSLKPLGGEALLAAAGLEPTRRAEEIDLDGFRRLALSVEGQPFDAR